MKPITDVRSFFWLMSAMLALALAFSVYHYRSASRCKREHKQVQSTDKWVILASHQTLSTPPSKFDLNTITAETITRELGIDWVIAEGVVRYRERLGGYVSTLQVEEIKGIDSESAFLLEKHVYISPSFVPNKILLSRVDRKRLAKHPYLIGPTANALTNHLRTHEIRSWGELVSVEGVDLDLLIKARPYLSLSGEWNISQRP